MTAIQVDVRLSTASNTLIKAYGSAISTSLQGVGLTKTTDTGQINWSTTTVTATTAAQTLGYEIFRFNDSQQALQPIFIRVDYMTAPGQNTVPGIMITTGSATDGAGNLAGLVTPCHAGTNDTDGASFSHPYAPYALTPTPHFFSGDGSSFAMALSPNDTGNPGGSAASVWYWFVERTRDLDGSYNTNGWIYGNVLSDHESNNFVTRFAVHSGLAGNAWGTNNRGLPIAYTGSSYGGSMGPNSKFTAYPMLVGIPKVQGQSLLTLGFQGGLAAYQTTELVVYGASHTYLALPAVASAMPGTLTESSGTSQNCCALLMRYE